MIRQVLGTGDLALYAEIGLVLFVVAFVGVLVFVLLSSSRKMADHAKIPLTDEPVDPMPGQHPVRFDMTSQHTPTPPTNKENPPHG